jgi:CrcB protein
VALGGFLGSVSRYLISEWVYCPMDTFFVNVAGSFLLGLLLYYFEYTGSSSVKLKLFLGIGFLGSFTTFSTFVVQTLEMNILTAMVNVMANVGIALLAVYLARAGAIFCQRRVW